jgi:uncharacterized phage protein gp47/JayE
VPHERPTLGVIVDRVIGDISSRAEGRAYVVRAAESVFGFVIGGVAHHLHGGIEWLFQQILPTTAELESLLRWARIAQQPRKGGARAGGGDITVTGAIGTVIEAGTRFLSASGAVIVTLETTTLEGDSADLAAAALDPGTAGNVAEGEALTLETSLPGLDDVAYDDHALTGGTDAEDIEPFRERVVDNVRRPPRAGGPGDYRGWALECEGVTRAWEYPHRAGVGTVSLTFVMDARANIIPTAEDVETVQAYLDERAPLDVRAVYVRAPIALPVTVTYTLVPDSGPLRTAIGLELRALFRAEAEHEQPLARSQVDEAISATAGETSHEITAIGSLVPGPWQILTFSSGLE